MYGYALKELWRHKGRTGANVLGYTIAVAIIVALLSIAQSYDTVAQGLLKKTGVRFIAFAPETQTPPESRQGHFSVGDVRTQLIGGSKLETVRKLPGVADASPYLLFKMYHPEDRVTLNIGGLLTDPIISPATQNNVCSPLIIREGRFLAPGEQGEVVVVEEAYARSARLHANDTLRAFGRQFKVVGVANCGIVAARADLYAPIGVVQEIARQYGKYPLGEGDMNVVLVEVADARIELEVLRSVQKVLGVGATSKYACDEWAAKILGVTDKRVLASSLIIALFVILFAAKSQLAAVVERTRDIGILKALGWSGSRVMGQILMESITQALMGGIVGSAIAILAVLGLRWSKVGAGQGITMGISYLAIVAGMVLVLIGGILAGILPAWKAFRLKPAEALRRL